MTDAFFEAAVWHGPLEPAAAILAAHPEIASEGIHTAAILGDATAVKHYLELDPTNANATGGPHGWDALTYLCFSKYLRLDSARSAAFLVAATSLLDAGANPNTGFFDLTHRPDPSWESALYGAAGVAHHAALTRLLLSRGADPNDGEVPYHAPETYNNGALEALVESRKLTPDSLASMLLRKCDWHDLEAIRYLLDHGADPNHQTGRKRTALVHALLRDNSLAIVDLLLDRGAQPSPAALTLAARRGRADVLQSCGRRAIPDPFEGVDRLIAACAAGRAEEIRALITRYPEFAAQLVAEGGTLLSEFAGTGNSEGVAHLLDVGVDVNAPYPGDPYFGIAPNSTALHVAAWRARHSTVQLLIQRGARVDAQDAQGRTPLALAVKACVDSYWSSLRSPESIAALLRAGASPAHITLPTGYAEADRLLTPAL